MNSIFIELIVSTHSGLGLLGEPGAPFFKKKYRTIH
jgi:hypothetical protein